jgi:DNA modification methylase
VSGTASIIRGNALDLPLADGSVDLIVTSPPYFGLRSYQDGGAHYEGQIGDEATPAEFVDALVAATAEMVRVLKPSGSIWVNLGDKYAQSASQWQGSRRGHGESSQVSERHQSANEFGQGTWSDAPKMGRPKSLIGVPWRYALRCIDELGLILRAEVIWSKPNGLPESVTDRVRRSHETWFHFVKSPRYFSAVDEIREEHLSPASNYAAATKSAQNGRSKHSTAWHEGDETRFSGGQNPLGKLPGSVWQIPTQPLRVPEHLGIDHFAAFPMEWPRRIIRGWSPSGVCVKCGEGRRPVTTSENDVQAVRSAESQAFARKGADEGRSGFTADVRWMGSEQTTITGYACACPEPTAPTRPAIVLDPFGGTGTTALVAKAIGRHGISNDMSADYCRLATWRCNDPGELARAMQVEKPAEQVEGQASLLDLIEEATA